MTRFSGMLSTHSGLSNKGTAAVRLRTIHRSPTRSARTGRATDGRLRRRQLAQLLFQKVHLVGKSVIDVVVHTKATTHHRTRCTSRLSSTASKSKRALSTTPFAGTMTAPRCPFRFDLTREADRFAVAVVAKVPAMTPSPSEASNSYRCGPSPCSFSTRCAASTVLDVASGSRKCLGLMASINPRSVIVSSWLPGPSDSVGRRPR